jgi:hypothetical protein
MMASNLTNRLLLVVAAGARFYIVARITGVVALLAYLYLRSS